jgi:hypothetical protein
VYNPDTLVLPPRSPLNLIAAVAPVGIAGLAGEYVPEANLKCAPIPREGGFLLRPNSVHTFVKVIVVLTAGVGIYYLLHKINVVIAIESLIRLLRRVFTTRQPFLPRVAIVETGYNFIASKR